MTCFFWSALYCALSCSFAFGYAVDERLDRLAALVGRHARLELGEDLRSRAGCGVKFFSKRRERDDVVAGQRVVLVDERDLQRDDARSSRTAPGATSPIFKCLLVGLALRDRDRRWASRSATEPGDAAEVVELRDRRRVGGREERRCSRRSRPRRAGSASTVCDLRQRGDAARASTGLSPPPPGPPPPLSVTM